MIRLIILALGTFLIWMLFFSGFSKQRRIVVSVLAIVVSAAGLWLEQRGETPRGGRMLTTELVSCGVSGKHSYRTNFDIEFCLENQSARATVKRVGLKFVAKQCIRGECREVQSISKELSLDLAPAERSTQTENINFSMIDPLDKSVVWSVQTDSVKAVF